MPENHTRLYLHLWEITPGTALLLGDLPNAPLTAKVLETGQPVPVHATDAGVFLQLPRELRGLELPVIALDIEGTVMAAS